jgi:hypothetical protein
MFRIRDGMPMPCRACDGRNNRQAKATSWLIADLLKATEPSEDRIALGTRSPN